MMTAPATIGFLLIPHFEETDEPNFKPDLFLKCLDPTRILSSGFSWLPNFPWNIPYLYPSFGGLHLWGWNPPEKCHPFSTFSQVSPSGRPPWATRPGDLGTWAITTGIGWGDFTMATMATMVTSPWNIWNVASIHGLWMGISLEIVAMTSAKKPFLVLWLNKKTNNETVN